MISRFITLACAALMLGFVGAGVSGISTMRDNSSFIGHWQEGVAEGRGDVAAGTALYDIGWHRIASGGETFAISDSYALAGTIGQHDAGVMAGGEYAIAGGFWAVAARACKAGDINCDGVVDSADLNALIEAWGECPDCDDCPADLNDDCVVDGADLLILLTNWG